jgi:hypothetical protein
MRKVVFIGGLLLVSVLFTFCKKDDPIWIFPIANPSFEAGIPGVLRVPDEWTDCGAEGETPPDLFKSEEKIGYNVTAISEDGSQYVGLVVRSNDTRECLFQELDQPIEGTIRGELLLARSNRYTSLDRITGDPVEYNTPASMEVIGVDDSGTDFLLYATQPVVDTNWTTVSFDFGQLSLLIWSFPDLLLGLNYLPISIRIFLSLPTMEMY